MARRQADLHASGGKVTQETRHWDETDGRTHAMRSKEEADDYRKHWGTVWFVLPNPMYGYWGPGQTVPAVKPEQSLRTYGFDVYLRGRRDIKR